MVSMQRAFPSAAPVGSMVMGQGDAMRTRRSGFWSGLWRWLRPEHAADGRCGEQAGGPYRKAAAVSAPDHGVADRGRNALLALDVYQDEALLRSVLFDPGKDLIQIGRQRGCDLRLDHPAVSRMHAVITVLGAGPVAGGGTARPPAPGLEIIDLGSAVGTRVNGKLADRQEISVGDVVELGLFQVQIALRYGKPGVFANAGTEPLPPAVE